MLFGIDPASSVAYRNARREQFELAEASLAKAAPGAALTSTSAPTPARINSLEVRPCQP